MSEIFTGKQERNGVAAASEVATQNSAQPSPDITAEVSALSDQAQAAADVWKNETKELFMSPAGADVGGFEIGPVGSMFQWDSGLAINSINESTTEGGPSSTTGVGDGK